VGRFVFHQQWRKLFYWHCCNVCYHTSSNKYSIFRLNEAISWPTSTCQDYLCFTSLLYRKCTIPPSLLRYWAVRLHRQNPDCINHSTPAQWQTSRKNWQLMNYITSRTYIRHIMIYIMQTYCVQSYHFSRVLAFYDLLICFRQFFYL
jgi:hypothetical protein